MQIRITDTLKEDKYEQHVHWIRSIDGSGEIFFHKRSQGILARGTSISTHKRTINQ